MDTDLSATDKNVFAALITFNGRGKIYPSRKAICERLGTNRIPTISNSIKNLENKGYIIAFRRKGKNNRYYFSNKTVEVHTEPTKPIKEKQVEMSAEEKEVQPVAHQTITASEKEKSILYSTVMIYSQYLYGRSFESGDFSVVRKLLKLKDNDGHSFAFKCLMLLQQVKTLRSKVHEKNFMAILYNSYRQSTSSDLRRLFQKPTAPREINSNSIPFLKRKIN